MSTPNFAAVLDEVYDRVKDHLAQIAPPSDGSLSARIRRRVQRSFGRGGVWSGNLFLNDQLKWWSVQFLANYANGCTGLDRLFERLVDEDSRRVMHWFVRYRLAYALVGPMAERLYPPWDAFDIAPEVGTWIDARTWTRDGQEYILDGPFDEVRRQVAYSLARDQYRLPGTVDARPGDHVVDAGACYGDTTVWYAKRVGPQGRVYAFEAMPANQAILQRNIDYNHAADNVRVFPMALWDRETDLYLSWGTGGSSKVEEGKGDIAASSLDILHDRGEIERVDFVKSDLEGAERRLLYGAKKVFMKYRPRVALSVYHGGEGHDDLSEIPRILLEYCPDYDFYLRCLTPTSFETVLFGVPRKGTEGA